MHRNEVLYELTSRTHVNWKHNPLQWKKWFSDRDSRKQLRETSRPNSVMKEKLVAFSWMVKIVNFRLECLTKLSRCTHFFFVLLFSSYANWNVIKNLRINLRPRNVGQIFSWFMGFFPSKNASKSKDIMSFFAALPTTNFDIFHAIILSDQLIISNLPPTLVKFGQYEFKTSQIQKSSISRRMFPRLWRHKSFKFLFDVFLSLCSSLPAYVFFNFLLISREKELSNHEDNIMLSETSYVRGSASCSGLLCHSGHEVRGQPQRCRSLEFGKIVSLFFLVVKNYRSKRRHRR